MHWLICNMILKSQLAAKITNISAANCQREANMVHVPRLCRIIYMCESRKFRQRRSNFLFVCFSLVDEGKENPYETISGPSSIHQRNTIPMAFRWRAYDGQTKNTGLEALCFSVEPDQYL